MKLPRRRCHLCGVERSIRGGVQRPIGWLCHKCFNGLTYANDRENRIPKTTRQRAKVTERPWNRRLSPERFDEMLAEQDGLCAICHQAPHGQRSLAIDHNHDTGEVRGLLCDPCNSALGLFQDDPAVLERARQYLIERGNYVGTRARRRARLLPADSRQ